MDLFHYADWPIPLREHSRYPLVKFSHLVDGVLQSTLRSSVRLLQAPRAIDSEILAVHTESYLTAVKEGTLTEQQQREMGFPNSTELVERGFRIAGATLAATQSALKDGISGVLGGGAHHSFADGGKGFCIFNDIAIGAKNLVKKKQASKVLIFDCDVHQGDGTAGLFQSDEDIITVSVHADSNYPFRKKQSDIDVGVSDDITDEQYLVVVHDTLLTSLALFEPDFVYFISGADPYMEDTLGKLSLSKECLAARDELVFRELQKRALPLCVLLAGGYCSPIDMTVQLNLQTYLIAHQVYYERKNAMGVC